jgi:hypothetical protein
LKSYRYLNRLAKLLLKDGILKCHLFLSIDWGLNSVTSLPGDAPSMFSEICELKYETESLFYCNGGGFLIVDASPEGMDFGIIYLFGSLFVSGELGD